VQETGLEMLEQALRVLRGEAAVAPSRELSLSITKAEEAVMWREKVDLHQQPHQSDVEGD